MKPTSARNPSIPDLWRDLRAWMAGALADFGGPAFILALFSRAAQTAVKRRLQLIESMLMKLLVVEAARLFQAHRHPLPDARAARGPGAMNAGRGKKPGAEDPNSPETWRVRFRPRLSRFMPPAARRARPHAAPARMRNSFAPQLAAHARKLARRYEAARRVIANPERAIAALARRLDALGAHARAVAHAIALARPRLCANAPAALAHAIVHANDASAVFNNTS